MFREDIKYLKCISCSKNLKIESFTTKKEEVIHGRLFCESCKNDYPIIYGVARMLPANLMPELVHKKYSKFFKKYGRRFSGTTHEHEKHAKEKVRTASSFGYEWIKYAKIIEAFDHDWDRYFNPFYHKNNMKGLVVAEIGCGLAKHGYFTAKSGAKYIGIDLSEAVDAAYKNTRQFRPLIIQADIYNLPIEGSHIDFYYCIGVLHHLPEPKLGFLSITNLMKKGSKVFIWVYGKHKNARALYFYNPLRAVTTRLPKSLVYWLCHIPAMATQLLNWVSMFLEMISAKKIAKLIPFYYYTKFPYSFKHNDSFDIFATPKQVYYEKKEIVKWFKDAKMLKVDIRFDKYQGIKGFGEK